MKIMPWAQNLEVGCRQLENGSWNPENGNQKPESEHWKPENGARKLETRITKEGDQTSARQARGGPGPNILVE
jgi:hypothetical protein